MFSDFGIDIKTRSIVVHLDARIKPSRMIEVLYTPLRTVQDWIQKIDPGIDIRKITLEFAINFLY